jgi:hypothetical protein
MSITKDYLHFPGDATIVQVLRTYLDRDAHWWWLLTTERHNEYYVCSFGSLLPYLTGRTPHIVHNIGDCPICSSMDEQLWKGTGSLVREALVRAAIRARRVADLPMAELPVVDVTEVEESERTKWLFRHASRVCGVVEDGVLIAMYVARMRGHVAGMPDF